MQAYWRLTCPDAYIEATEDHVIGGLAIQRWLPGMNIMWCGQDTKVVSVERVAAFDAIDIKVDGGYPYMANGFLVDSMAGDASIEDLAANGQLVSA
jgi:hypothetical protein